MPGLFSGCPLYLNPFSRQEEGGGEEEEGGKGEGEGEEGGKGEGEEEGEHFGSPDVAPCSLNDEPWKKYIVRLINFFFTFNFHYWQLLP